MQGVRWIMTSVGGARSSGLDDRRQGWLLAGVCLAYVVALLFCDFLTRGENGMPALWPVNAIVTAGMLHLTPGRRVVLWAVFSGMSVVVHRLAGDPWALVAIYMVCDTTEVLLATLIARRVTRGRAQLRSVGKALLLLAAVLPVTTVTAAVGSAMSALILGQDFWTFFTDWFFCTALGMAIALPAALVILDPERPTLARRKPLAVQLVLYSFVAALAAVAFSSVTNPMPFLIFPAAMLAAFQLGPKGAAWSAAIVIAIAAPLTVAGFGPTTINPSWTEPDRIRMVQAFVSTLFFTCLAASLSLYREDRLKQLMARRTAVAHAARARAQEASRAKTEFLATMSHEIRTPLNSILGFSNLLGATEPLSCEGQRKLDLIAQAGASLVTIVDDVLDFSRIEAGRIELDLGAVSPAALFRDTAAIIAPGAEAKGLDLTLDIQVDEDAFYRLDESRLRQVLLNLLNNAVKFTPSGAVVARLRIETGRTGSELIFEISDTGIGIAPEQHARLFQRFSQADGSIRRNFGGAGLGLAICKALVSLMDGQIGVGSAAGEGSTFWVRLPVQLVEPDVAASSVEPQRAIARILLVDDHPMNRELGKAFLELVGCEVETAEDGDIAVHMAAEGGFDMILMDIHMPRMDGLAASQAIRALGGAVSLTPIIALSADAMPEQVERCRRAGMVDHLAKPIDREALYAAVERWLAHSPLAA